MLVLALLALSAARGCAGQAQDDDWDASEFESAFIDGDDEPDTPPPPRQARRQQQKVAPASTSQATNLDWDDSEFEGFPDDADTVRVPDDADDRRRRCPSLRQRGRRRRRRRRCRQMCPSVLVGSIELRDW